MSPCMRSADGWTARSKAVVGTSAPAYAVLEVDFFLFGVLVFCVHFCNRNLNVDDCNQQGCTGVDTEDTAVLRGPNTYFPGNILFISFLILLSSWYSFLTENEVIST